MNHRLLVFQSLIATNLAISMMQSETAFQDRDSSLSRSRGTKGLWRRFRTRLVDPATLATIPVIGLFFLLRPLKLIAPLPYWAIAVVLVAVALTNTITVAAFPDASGGWRLVCRVGVEMGVIAVVVYAIGWGPILAVGFVFCAADAMRSSSSAVAKPAIIWMVIFIAFGQLAIYLGLAPTLIAQPLVHGLALLGAAGAALTIKVLEWFALSREASEARFKGLVQNATDIVAVVDPSGCFSYVSPSFTRVLGWSTADFDARPAADLLHSDDLEKLNAQVAASAEAPSQLMRSEVRLQHSDGTWRWFEATVSYHLDDPNISGIVANLHDITGRKALEEELRHQAFHDVLTGLANRALFIDRAEHALARQKRSGDPLAVLLVDLDDFKAINDSLGHDVGDRLLAEVGSKLGDSVRASDTVARLGGDEFAILLEESVEANGPEQLAERIITTFGDPIMVDGRSFAVSASVGLALSTLDTSSADELIGKADMAMYSAKANGKGRWARFEAPMHAAVQKRLEVKTDLLKAISEGDQMELYYQPIVNLVTREVTAVEALLRWNNPDRGVEAPMQFLPVAEESGLILALGRWVLSQAVGQLATWRSRYPSLSSLKMNINVSGRQLEDPRFINDVHDILEGSGVDPSLIVLEITESILMQDTKDTIVRLSKLKRLGLRLAIDDFGTGYSSLGYLRHFPVDILKVDRSFISDIGNPSRQGALAEAVVGMGAILDLQTVAEGVETEEQALRLPSLDCVYGQGFLFSVPVPAAKCENLVCEMVETNYQPGQGRTAAQELEARSGSCRGTLVFHKDSSVDCSESACLISKGAEKGLGTHPLVVICRQSACTRCYYADSATFSSMDLATHSS